MGRNSSCVKHKLRKGLWSPEEDEKLQNYITKFGVGCWSSVPKLAGLQRCGKSCRLRWINYLRPDLKRGMFSQEEENLIINLHEALGNRWAQIAAQLPGRTDNEIKNFWNSCLKKKLAKQGIDPNTHKPMIIVNNEEEPRPNNINIDYEKLISEQQQHHPKQVYGQYSNTVAPAVLLKENNNCNVGGKLQQVYDPFFLPEFQASVDPHGYSYSDFASSCCPQINPGNFGLFNSMPDLANFESSSGKGNVVIEDKFDSCMSFEYGVRIQEHGSQGFSGHYPMTSSLSDQLPLITAGPNMQDDAPLFHQI
ncbi:hypothetical protein ACP275_09G017300 [Erythranthe tilingii]